MTRMAPLVRIEMRFHPLQKVGYEATLEALKHRYGPERPEWWCLAIMARHFLEMDACADDDVKRIIARQVIQRVGYTCGAPECLMRGVWRQTTSSCGPEEARRS